MAKKSLEETLAEDAAYYQEHAESVRRFIEKGKEKKRRFPWRGRGKDETVSRQGLREEWAHKQGYASWDAFYGKTRRRDAGRRYLALLTNLYRARVPDAEKIANAVFLRKSIPRKKLVREALALSRLPLLPAPKKKRVLPKYGKK